MSRHASTVDLAAERKVLGKGANALTVVLGIAGVAGLGAAWVLAGEAKRFWFAYLTSYGYVASIALGALFFILIQHVTRAGWSVVVRRPAEAIVGAFPILAVLALPLLAGAHDLYHWTHAEAVGSDALLAHKSPWLNLPFFGVRLVVYVAAWTLVGEYFRRKSFQQDSTGDKALTLAQQSASPVALIVFGFTLTFASFDLLKSLDPHWFSTMYGVYYFAGAVVGGTAFLIVLSLLVQKNGVLRQTITREHYHDLGKLLFAFTCFWAYIAYSQYMLYWYANIPEETIWYLRRQEHGWDKVGLFLAVGHFVLPFLLLLSRHAKRHRRFLGAMAAWMLFVHWVDIAWLVLPDYGATRVVLGPVDLAAAIGVGGLSASFALWRMQGRSWLAERDPRLMESVNFENA